MAQAWIVRAGRNDEYEAAAFSAGLVGIGWRRVGDLAVATSLTAVRRRVKQAYPSVTAQTQETYALQLNAFRSAMSPGDPVVLVRENSPDLALGEIAGEYQYLPSPAGQPPHVRSVAWRHREVRRSEIGADLITAPALSAVFRITRASTVERLRQVAAGDVAGAAAPPAGPAPVDGPPTAVSGLARNLNYARSLTEAGRILEQLGVTSFEVTDVYRAAWVQAVAALDHWVHQEIRERMLRLAEHPQLPRPTHFSAIELPLGVVEDIQHGNRTLRDAIDDRLQHGDHARQTYQQPDAIRLGLRQVADVDRLWQRVAVTLSERAGGTARYTAEEVKERLANVVQRRNKIAHEYDEDLTVASGKRDIDAASTMHTIEWIDQIAEAVRVVIDGK